VFSLSVSGGFGLELSVLFNIGAGPQILQPNSSFFCSTQREDDDDDDGVHHEPLSSSNPKHQNPTAKYAQIPRYILNFKNELSLLSTKYHLNTPYLVVLLGANYLLLH
jgi:hypothetical protein